VSSSVGPFIPKLDLSKKCKLCSRLFGNVLEEAANRKYKLQFDDGETHVVASNILRLEQASASRPPSERLPPPPPIGQARGNEEENNEVDAAPLADKESVEDELGDPDREKDDGEESGEEEGQGAATANAQSKTQAETGGVFVGEDLPKNTMNASKRHRKRLRVFLGKQ